MGTTENSEFRPIGFGEYRAAEASASRTRTSRRVRQRRDAFAGERYDHGTLGNGGGVAGPSVPSLQKRIPAGRDCPILTLYPAHDNPPQAPFLNPNPKK